MPHPVVAEPERDREVLLVPALLARAGLERVVRHGDERAVRDGHVDGDVAAGGIEEMVERRHGLEHLGDALVPGIVAVD